MLKIRRDHAEIRLIAFVMLAQLIRNACRYFITQVCSDAARACRPLFSSQWIVFESQLCQYLEVMILSSGVDRNVSSNAYSSSPSLKPSTLRILRVGTASTIDSTDKNMSSNKRRRREIAKIDEVGETRTREGCPTSNSGNQTVESNLKLAP